LKPHTDNPEPFHVQIVKRMFGLIAIGIPCELHSPLGFGDTSGKPNGFAVTGFSADPRERVT